MCVNVLTVGHIKFLKKLFDKGNITVGLFTSKAMKGYKKELMSFKHRKYILESLYIPLEVVPQNTLDPYENLIKYECNAIASGDGWEPCEKKAAKKLGIKMINIKSGEKIHSSDIKQ